MQIYPTPDSKYVYVADQGYYFNQPNSDLVYKIDLQEMKVAETIKSGTAPHGVVVSQDGKFVYVTNLLSDDLSVIDTSAGKRCRENKSGQDAQWGEFVLWRRLGFADSRKRKRIFNDGRNSCLIFGSIALCMEAKSSIISR